MKKMKKAGVLVSAIATTAVCASMIAGSTFALFTSEDQVDITVSSGNVSITADVNGSIKTPVSIKKTNDGYEIGEYETSTSAGFNATSDGLINVTNVIPGDKVELTVGVENTGSVKAKYNFTLECVEGVSLMNKLVVDVEEDTVNATDGVKKYTSDWAEIDAGAKATYNLTLELPASLDNAYKNLSTKIKTTVFAVQYNADMANPVSNVENFPVVSGVADLTKGGLLVLNSDLALTDTVTFDKDTEIDLGGNTLSADKLLEIGNGADVVIANGKFVSQCENNASNCALNIYGDKSEVQTKLTLDNVDVESYAYGIGIRNYAWLQPKSTEPLVTINGGSISTEHPYACAIGTSAALGNNNGLAPDIKNALEELKQKGEDWSTKNVFEGGKVVMNGTTINSNGSGIMLTVPVDMELNNCTINSRMQCLVIRAGNVTLNGCTLNNNIYNENEFEESCKSLSYYNGYMGSKYLSKGTQETWQAANNTDLAAIVLGNNVGSTTSSYAFNCKVTVINTVINQKNGISEGQAALVYIHGDPRVDENKMPKYTATFAYSYSEGFKGVKLDPESESDIVKAGNLDSIK